MRRIGQSRGFKKIYKKRVAPNPKLAAQFEKMVALFASRVSDYPIYDHALTGKLRGKRSFSISGDVRVIYEVIDETCVFIDVGAHNQVYK